MSRSAEFLAKAYQDLGFQDGMLVSVDVTPSDVNEDVWLIVKDWADMAREAGAEALYFVDGSPVIVFAKSDADEDAMRKAFNRVWCLARPALLVLSTPISLSVYQLSQPPARDLGAWQAMTPLALVTRVAEVAQRLSAFRRELIDTGRTFEDKRFRKLKNRADQALIRDLKYIRSELYKSGLPLDIAHALIGRSIFVRYLEDRGILTREYFEDVASSNPKRLKLLNEADSLATNDLANSTSYYIFVLKDIDFTYDIYAKIFNDFNGDIFPKSDEESSIVEDIHLRLLRDLLLGDTGAQVSLFFWAYQFDVIPIELISSIYEEFYHASNTTDDKGTHYTPISLVDFTLSRVLTAKCLSQNPRVLDPACGSGIFLVESFRRIVRYNLYINNNRPLLYRDLISIIDNQIAGIEINEEAIRVSAFSLYLALLDYLDPPDILTLIRQGEYLPHFIASDCPHSSTHLHILLKSNAFDVNTRSAHYGWRFTDGCADVVVGNPPWGSPGRVNSEGRAAFAVAEAWYKRRGHSVGDLEWSQAFIWRTLSLLRSQGASSLLVSGGILFNRGKQGVIKFRRQWLSSVKLHEVVNFTHVRKLFFSGGTSPFVSIHFTKKEPGSVPDQLVSYWSAKKTAQVATTQSVILSHTDLHVVPQVELAEDDRLWKIYWWGSHRDAAFITSLDRFAKLEDITSTKGQGFKEAKQNLRPSDWLQEFQYLPTRSFNSYDQLQGFQKPPPQVQHRGKRDLYEGKRLLVKRGKSSSGKRIAARVSQSPFCFRHSIQAVKLKNEYTDLYDVVLGILWSGFAKYYLFFVSSNWGVWHEDVQLDELLELPVPLEENDRLLSNVVECVATLRMVAAEASFFGELDRTYRIQEAEASLDESVSDLFRLSAADRILVRDFNRYSFDLLHKGNLSKAASPIPHAPIAHGVVSDVKGLVLSNPIYAYIRTFVGQWNAELPHSMEFAWRLVVPYHQPPMIAVVLLPIDIGAATPDGLLSGEKDAWRYALDTLLESTHTSLGGSQVYSTGQVRIVTEEAIVIIKRNERRLWTDTTALLDAEATKVQVIGAQSI